MVDTCIYFTTDVNIYFFYRLAKKKNVVHEIKLSFVIKIHFSKNCQSQFSSVQIHLE